MKILVSILLLVYAKCTRGGVYTDRFLTQYEKIHDLANGYFSSNGVPYRCPEGLAIVSTDYGHTTDSEALSYFIWLQATYGGVTGDFSPFNNAWQMVEDTLVPKLQPSTSKYNHSAPILSNGLWVGVDPLFQELANTYGTSDMYILHWLADVDNKYGFGNVNGKCEAGPGETGPSLIQLGSGSIFQQIPSPTCDNWVYGGNYGFQYQDSDANRVWIYGAGPDADARAVQASFWASQYAKSLGKIDEISGSLQKASRLGDYLRYVLFDKSFKTVGNCIDPLECAPGTDRESAHYLLSWTISWGGSVDPNGWAWRVGSSTNYYAYQNPIAAYALSSDPNLIPRSPTAANDWKNSVERQVEFFEYTQSVEGSFAGAVTNSWKDNYEVPPSNLLDNTFYGMFYMPSADGSSTTFWYGQQAWAVDRLVQYYYISDDQKAKAILDKWVAWLLPNIKFDGNSYSVPNFLTLSGVPPSVSVSIQSSFNAIGTASATARILSYYAAKTNNAEAKNVAKELLDRMWALHQTQKGVSITETKDNYNTGFNTKVNIPLNGWTGTYPNNVPINADSTFLSIRPWFKDDPEWYKVENYLAGGPAPQFNFHQMIEQADIAISLATYGLLFNE
ncbi:exoglucanase B-like [Cylas formicarius]|uniref:exoglucanase B-like n=1 Tax=Cylas formicarius TaxID=197179 RepID=UPI0029583DBE|nr:exoglucanase B-like [Cylas formicarius]